MNKKIFLDIQDEWIKCYQDKTRIHMIKTYLKTRDVTQGNKNVPFKLFPKQEEYIRNLEEYTENIATKPRQSGITTCTAAKIACEIAMASLNSPVKVLIVCNRLDLSQDMLRKIKAFLDQFPQWFWDYSCNTFKETGEFEYYKDAPGKNPFVVLEGKDDVGAPYIVSNSKKIELKNGCEIYAVSSGPNATRGISAPTWIIFDEAAFIDNGVDVYTAAVAAGSTGAKVVMISTPHGKDQLYYQTYVQAKSHQNSFKLTEMRWYQDPRYNRYLSWYKIEESEDENGNKEKKRIVKKEDVDMLGNLSDFNIERLDNLYNDGWHPTSPWFEAQCRRYNNNAQKIAQELEVSFLGSDNNVIPVDVIDMHERKNVRDKEGEYIIDKDNENTWIWDEPKKTSNYIMTIDVSRGDGDDSSVIEILEISTDIIYDKEGNVLEEIPILNQSLEYYGKMPANKLGELAFRYGMAYNKPLVVVDCIGGVGDACVLKLKELGYDNLYYDDDNLKKYTADNNYFYQYTDNKDKMPGFHFKSVRENMINNFVIALSENKIKIRSRRCINEMDTWVYRNGRPDHKDGCHDDALMSLAMGYIVYEFSYVKTLKNKKIQQGIKDAWTVNIGGSIQKNNDNLQQKYNGIMPVISISSMSGNDGKDDLNWLFK